MLTRELKLKLNRTQEKTLNAWLWNLTGVYNWAIRKIELNAKDKIYFSQFDFVNLLSNHGKKLDIPSHTIQGVLSQAYIAWDRCFKKIGRKPHLKSVRNKLNSIPFPDPIKNPIDGKVKIPGFGTLRFHKYTLPQAKIKCGRILKRASGWYLQLTYDAVNKFEVKQTNKSVGIDTGFKSLLTLSDGTKIENNRHFVKLQERMAQVQRGRNKKKIARLHEKIANQRKDYNHKVSRKIVEEYSEIYITNDNLRGQASMFGKSIGDAGIGQLRNFISYKGVSHGRKVSFVSSYKSTMICSACGSESGPHGMSGLAVRDWECKVCGTRHDRDVNAAINILNLGAGTALKQTYALEQSNA
jgi:transposase